MLFYLDRRSTESLIAKLFTLVRREGEETPPSLMHHAFKFLYLISKVRGAKVVVRWFSHEVSDLQPVLQLLQKQDMKDHEVHIIKGIVPRYKG